MPRCDSEEVSLSFTGEAVIPGHAPRLENVAAGRSISDRFETGLALRPVFANRCVKLKAPVKLSTF
jgi:hypothetical protein